MLSYEVRARQSQSSRIVNSPSPPPLYPHHVIKVLPHQLYYISVICLINFITYVADKMEIIKWNTSCEG